MMYVYFVSLMLLKYDHDKKQSFKDNHSQLINSLASSLNTTYSINIQADQKKKKQ